MVIVVCMQKELPVRKHPRLKGYDYSTNGAYFITLCVKDKHEKLGRIVGRDVLIAPPDIRLSEYGECADKHINKINQMCAGFSVDKYVIMPNHIHMIIIKTHDELNVCDSGATINNSGAMRTSRPTSKSIPSVMRSFKTMVTKEIGFSLWQDSYHDHIIRDEAEYRRIWQYIDENPARWAEDDYYI